MKFPITTPIRHLDELIDSEVLGMDKQNIEVGSQSDRPKCLRDRQAWTSDLGSHVIWLYPSLTTMERYDGQVIIREHGRVYSSQNHLCGHSETCDQHDVKQEYCSKLHDLPPLAGFIECVPGVHVECIPLQLEAATQC